VIFDEGGARFLVLVLGIMGALKVFGPADHLGEDIEK
jgi:hypothetical protein